jgi:hypothetical protein
MRSPSWDKQAPRYAIGPGRTTLRADLPDRGAFAGLIQRISHLGLDVIDVSLVTPPPER